MKKFFLTTCLIIMTSLAFSQGLFNEQELKKYGLELKEYSKSSDRYIYQLKSKNKKDFYGGQSKHFDFQISYYAEYNVATLDLTFSYEGKSTINLTNAVVSIDGQRKDFVADKVFNNKVEYPSYWLYYERFFRYLIPTEEDLDILNYFYLGLDNAKDVRIYFHGKTGLESYKLTKKEIEASNKIVDLYMNVVWDKMFN